MKEKNKYATLEAVLVMILGLYPLRHIYWGLDLWDTGYNYANFVYMGLEHMDPMWLFSTYLANVVGNFLTKLPSAGSLAGMNLYTGIFVSVLAIAGYLFCTRKLKISPIIAFVGEFIAISLCWCPTALLYNYLTYVLFLGCVICLYIGLVQEKKWCLFVAGICLGTNVFVRFSNLPEAAMIVAVWAYGVIEALDYRKKCRAKHLEQAVAGNHTKEKGVQREKIQTEKIQNEKIQNGKTQDKKTQSEKPQNEKEQDKKRNKSGAWSRTVNRTWWCLGGYVTAFLFFLAHIGIRYGVDNYVTGIQQLFAMTDNATDYKATSMLTGLIYTYTDNLYWVIRMLVIVLAGMLACGVLKWLEKKSVSLTKNAVVQKVLDKFCYVVCIGLAVAMLVWLYVYANNGDGFCSWAFYSYDSMLRPGILFLILTMFIAIVRIFQKNCSKEEKLIAGMVLLVVLLTSIGSNNGVYPSLNNLFVAAPYTLWQCGLFMKVKVTNLKVRNLKIRNLKIRNLKIGKRGSIILHPLPAKCILTAFIAMFVFQSVMFGAKFVFTEATGAQDVSVMVENNEVLKGIKMSPEKAEWVSSISAYVKENNLQGKEVILYGQIPALSYYLQMPSAFNSWSDLRSYSVKRMESDMLELEQQIAEKGAEHPVIIVENTYANYFTGGSEALVDMGMGQEKINTIAQDAKWQILVEFIEKYGYKQTFSNGKFVIWE